MIVRFGVQARACRVDIPMSRQKQTHRPSTKVSWLFDKLSDNNASVNGLSLLASVAVYKQISEVILTPDNYAILMAYQLTPIIILMHVTVQLMIL